VIVQWVGGPDDGDMFEVPKGTRTIAIAVLEAVPFRKLSGDEYENVPVNRRTLPIEKVNGRYFVRYPGGAS
jgi:hypothetical protein